MVDVTDWVASQRFLCCFLVCNGATKRGRGAASCSSALQDSGAKSHASSSEEQRGPYNPSELAVNLAASDSCNSYAADQSCMPRQGNSATDAKAAAGTTATPQNC